MRCRCQFAEVGVPGAARDLGCRQQKRTKILPQRAAFGTVKEDWSLGI